MEYYEFKFTDIYDREWKVWASDTQTVKMIRSVDSEFKKYVLSISDNYDLDNIKVSPLYNLEIYDIAVKNRYYIEAKVGIVSKKTDCYTCFGESKYKRSIYQATEKNPYNIDLSEYDDRYEAKCMMYYKIINSCHFLLWTSNTVKNSIDYEDYLLGHTPKYLMKQFYKYMVIDQMLPDAECMFDSAYINAMKRIQKTNNEGELKLIPPDYDTVLIEFCILLLKYERNGVKIDDRIRSKYMRKKIIECIM